MHTTTHRSETVGQLILVDVDPTRQQVNRAIAGFLAGYSGATLEAYQLDLRQWVSWLDERQAGPMVLNHDGRTPSTASGRSSSTTFGSSCASPSQSGIAASTKTRRWRTGVDNVFAIAGRRRPAPLWPTTTSVSLGHAAMASLTTAAAWPDTAACRRSGTATSCPAAVNASATHRHVTGPTG